MDILLNIYLTVVKFCIDNDNIPLEGRGFQIFDLGLSFCFSKTKRVTFCHFCYTFNMDISLIINLICIKTSTHVFFKYKNTKFTRFLL